MCSSDLFMSAVAGLGIDLDRIFEGFVPHPVAFFNVLLPSFVEAVIERVLFEQGGLKKSGLPKTQAGRDAYEAYDLHYEGGRYVVPVDCKRWGRPSDARLSPKIESDADDKASRIKRAFGKEPMPIYMNLIGDSEGGARKLDNGTTYMACNLFIERQGRVVLNMKAVQWMRRVVSEA